MVFSVDTFAWGESSGLYSSAEISFTQPDPEAPLNGEPFRAALDWRVWMERHAPALVGWIGFDAVERLEEGGYQLTDEAAQTPWHYPDLTPSTYFVMGWPLLDRKQQLARTLARSWTRRHLTSPAPALLVLRIAAQLEELNGGRLDPLNLEAWFLEGAQLCEEEFSAFCAALSDLRQYTGQPMKPDGLRALREAEQPTKVLQLGTALLAPLHALGRALPHFLVDWYLGQLAHPSAPGADSAAPGVRLEVTSNTLRRITERLCAFQQCCGGKLPVYLEAEMKRVVFPTALEAYLVSLVTETLPLFLQAAGGSLLPLAVLEAVPASLVAEVACGLSAVFSWSAWKRLLNQFHAEYSFPFQSPPHWVVQGACALLLTFGHRWHDWLRACEQKQHWGVYEASHWLPYTPAPGLGAWLMQHVETAQERLAWVAKHWQDSGFPRAGTLAQMRVWELSGALRKEVPGVPEGVVEQLLPLMEYDLEPSVLCAAVQEILPALRGEIVVNRRLVGGFEREEGRTIRFLAKTDPLGLALGEATHCCQQWGGVGQACMEAGYMRPDSTFLVLEQGADILAQAWVWIGSGPDGEALVLDNIEIPRSPRLSPNDVVAMVRRWASAYAEQTGLGVKLGTGSADYQLVDLVPAPSSRLDGYSGYTDATYQRWLALPPALAHLPAGVRRATELDGHALNTLEREIYPAVLCTGVEVPSGDQGFALLYEEEGQPLGYLIVQVGYDWQEHGEGYAEDLAVLPSARRRAAMPLAEAFRRYATAYGLTHLYAHLRETTSHKLLKRHGERLGLVIEREDGWEERACGERFMPTHIRIVPGV